MRDLESVENMDNSIRQPLTGWKLGWKLFMSAGLTAPDYYRDSAFPACPACGSPNVMLAGSDQSYLCLERDCKSKGSCEVKGGDGIRQRKAKARYTVFYVALAILGTVLYIIIP